MEMDKAVEWFRRFSGRSVKREISGDIRMGRGFYGMVTVVETADSWCTEVLRWKSEAIMCCSTGAELPDSGPLYRSIA